MWTFIVVVYILFLFNLIIRRLRSSKGDPKEQLKEPSLLGPDFPVIGHLLGFYKYGAEYFKVLRPLDLPIFTINIFATPMYVVTCPRIASAIQRSNKTLSFNPLIAAVSRRVLKLANADMKKMAESEDRGNRHSGFMNELRDVHHKVLGTGLSLDRLRDALLGDIAQFANLTAQDSSISINLYAWIRHVHTFSTVSAVWGPRHPLLEEPSLEEDFWKLESELPRLLVDVLPQYTAPGSIQAHRKLTSAFSKYYETGGNGNENAPDFIEAKKGLSKKYDLSDSYNPRADIGELMGMLFNVVPTSFWLLLYIFSSPSLLADLRAEIRGLLTLHEVPDPVTKIRTQHGHLNLTQLKQDSPLLHSTWQEVLRVVSSVTTNRYVLDDTIINGEILLKRGGIVQIPGAVMHMDSNLWGLDANDFNPRRFMAARPKQHPAAFRPFGGGSTLCPGRHLAHTEILGFAALMILGFDLESKTGKWELPEKNTRCLPGVLKPVRDIEVIISQRAGFERIKWSFERFSQ